MTHRTVDFGAGPVEVFDTSFAAMRWAKKNPFDCIVLARNSFYFQRKNGSEITVRLNATDCPENRHLVAAANSVADEVERMLADQTIEEAQLLQLMHDFVEGVEEPHPDAFKGFENA